MIHISELAASKITTQLQRRGRGVGVRLGVKTTGCSGLAYTMEFVDKYIAEAGVTNFTQNSFVVLVDAKSLVYVNGLTVDWTRNGLNEGFDFKNPNERDRCGCGESFRV